MKHVWCGGWSRCLLEMVRGQCSRSIATTAGQTLGCCTALLLPHYSIATPLICSDAQPRHDIVIRT